MSTYSLQDFSESLSRCTLPAKPVEVVRAWGESMEGPGCDWAGGFIMRLENGQFAYLSGWCDYTGWGCQDGAHLTLSDSLESLDLEDRTGRWTEHMLPSNSDSWDAAPADLNRWIAKGMPDEAEMYNDIGRKA